MSAVIDAAGGTSAIDAFTAPWWLPGGNLQTIWPVLFSQHHAGAAPRFRRERWNTPDGDFVDVDFLEQTDAAHDAPLLALFHGLEGSSGSHYALAFAQRAAALGWRFAVPHFRGCSGELNLAPRAYHSGDFEEVGWLIGQLRERHRGPMLAAGVSLGGNALMCWAGEAGESAARQTVAVAAISSPVDLAAGGEAIIRGFNRQVYNRMFMNSMKPKALRKLAQHPGLFDAQALRAARDLYEFDNIFTAPLHGFRNTEDYWARASSKPRLASVRIPALVLNALNDPFVPAASLPRPGEVGRHVTLWQPPHGGHVGFPAGAFPGHVHALPEDVTGWLAAHLPSAPPAVSQSPHG